MSVKAGYSNQKKLGASQYETVHNVGSDKFASNVVQKSLAEYVALPIAITGKQVSLDQSKVRYTIPAHGALKVGDVLRIMSGNAIRQELDIISIIDANTLEVYNVLVSMPEVADTVKTMFYVSAKSDAEGNVNFSPGPTTFVRNLATETVTEDTSNPALNRGLPALVTFYKDGNQVTVKEDTITPANNEPLPVKLTGVTGDVIINAGDLNVSTSATNDSMAIGDAVTGNTAKVDLNSDGTTYAMKVKDDDANAALSAIQTSTGASATEATLATVAKEVTLDAVKTAVESLALEDFATLAEQQAQTTELGQISSDAQVIASAINVDGNPANITGLMIGGKDSSGDFQQAAVNAAGELSVTFGSAGFATETTLSALNNKVANDYGASSGAVRSAAQIGNATGQADFNSGADSAQTLRVSANIKRNGNELSYNSGAADANTLRSVLATRHESATTPLSTRLSDGTDFISSEALPASRLSIATATKIIDAAAIIMGWDGTSHKEVLLAASGAVVTEDRSKDGTITNAQITVGLTAVRATVSGSAPSSGRRKLIIKPSKNNSGSIFFGSSTVTTSNGMEIIGPDRLEFEHDHADWYLISDTAGQKVEIIEVV